MITRQYNKQIKQQTTFGIDAECGCFIEYDSLADLRQLHQEGILANAISIGGGSNILFTAGGFEGTILHNRNREIDISAPDERGTCIVTAAAGVNLDHLCRLTCEHKLWGLENLSGIPGEVSGATVQNVGAYGTELKDTCLSVETFNTATGETVTLSAAECRFGYRDSIFKHGNKHERLIVCTVKFRLNIYPQPNLSYKALNDRFASTPQRLLTPSMFRDAVIEMRNSKLPDPAVVGSAGSFFKNPVILAAEFEKMQKKTNKDIPHHVLTDGRIKLVAAWLIDNADCKQLSVGGAAVWQTQPLVLVNATGSASGNDVCQLESQIIARVKETFSVDLQPEVVHIGIRGTEP